MAPADFDGSGDWRRLAAHLEEGCESERKRLAHSIHDQIGQLLVQLQFSLGNAEAPEVRGYVQEALRSARELVLGLRPGALDAAGAAAAIEWCCGVFQARTGIPCHTARLHDLSLDEWSATALFRIAQAALAQIEATAAARCVSVSLIRRHSHAELQIHDDGPPWPFDELFSLWIELRSSMAGGNSTILNEPGEGTLLTVSIPLTGGAQR
jgi:signal transduction histidine kinase